MSNKEEEALDQDFLESVVEHMNADHGDACLAIVRAFSPYMDAATASLRTMSRQGMQFEVSKSASDSPNDSTIVQINFTKPILRESQIRGQLVAMSKMAREKLSEEP